MKSRLLALCALVLLASSAFAGRTETVLTSDNSLWAIDGCGERAKLELTRRDGNHKETVVVPSTEDEALEADPRLAWDSSTGDFFVLYRRIAADADQILLARLTSGGKWAEPLVVSDAPARNAALQLLLSHAKDGKDEATLLHAVWWELREGGPLARYALVAFEDGEHASTDVTTLSELAGLTTTRLEYEDTGAVPYPPLAIAKTSKSIEAAFGALETTAITRVKIEPRRVEPNARFWRPVGRHGDGSGPARFVSANSAPVESFIRNDRVVLYTPDVQFRYVVLDGGKWSPVRVIQLDEKMTSDRALEELRRSIDAHVAVDEDEPGVGQ